MKLNVLRVSFRLFGMASRYFSNFSKIINWRLTNLGTKVINYL